MIPNTKRRDERKAAALKKKERSKKKKVIRKKPCKLCADRVVIDYKDAGRMQRFVTERGKIIPRRINGNCAQCQRDVNAAVKHARQMALLAYNSY